ncbi:hypothetical protein F5Y14DRAFT_421517 [Nemania sp. NC0429]|nr:hypothetical protein F5Y14DRAFT_421517 [Nemania sp. NC0429]
MTSSMENRKAWHYLPGFGSLADFIASDSDHSTKVYRRFDRLTSRNLLYYQSELARLEAIQDRYDIEDRRDVEDPQKGDSCDEIRRIARDWNTLSQLASRSSQASGSVITPIDEKRQNRIAVAMEIRNTMKEYQKALIRESTLLSLERPSKQTMEALSNYFHNSSATPNNERLSYSIISGDSSHLYPQGMSSGHIEASDYVSLSKNQGSDLLTRFLKAYCSRLFRIQEPSILPHHQGDIITHLPKRQVLRYSLPSVRFAASFIATLTAAILLFLPIFTLYHAVAAGPALTLGLIALFTVLFAGALFLMTQARRAEIFGGCAAYAAVLVVFVSGDFASGNKGMGS